MSLDITATNEWIGKSREAEAAHRFVSLYHSRGHVEALSFHASLPPELKDYVKYSVTSQEDFRKARAEVDKEDARNL